MKRLLALPLCGLLIALAACGGNPPAQSQPESRLPGEEEQSPEPLSQGPEAPAGEEGPYGRPVEFEGSDLPAAYGEAVEAYCRTGAFPDGQESGEIPGGIAYAVWDVDGDGRDELILQNTQEVTAAQVELVYGYDEETGLFRQELSQFPALTYYDNGVVQADWAHNQGWAGDFWPYTLYRYDAGADAYKEAGSVDAWDETQHPVGFPQEVDADGDGLVYFLLTDNWRFVSHAAEDGQGYWTYETAPVDGAEYLAWRDGLLQDAAPVEIPYRTVEVERIFPNAAG